MNVSSLSNANSTVSFDPPASFNALHDLLNNKLRTLPFDCLVAQLEHLAGNSQPERMCPSELKLKLLGIYGTIAARLYSGTDYYTPQKWFTFYYYFSRTFHMHKEPAGEGGWYAAGVSLMGELAGNPNYPCHDVGVWHDHLARLLYVASEPAMEFQEDDHARDRYIDLDRRFIFSILESRLEPQIAEFLIGRHVQSHPQSGRSFSPEQMRIYVQVLMQPSITADVAFDAIERLACKDLRMDSLEILLSALLERFTPCRELAFDKLYRTMCLICHLMPKLENSCRWKQWLAGFSAFFWKDLSNSSEDILNSIYGSSAATFFSGNAYPAAMDEMMDLFLHFKRLDLFNVFIVEGAAHIFLHMMSEIFMSAGRDDMIRYLRRAEPLFQDIQGLPPSSKIKILTPICSLISAACTDECEGEECLFPDGGLQLYRQIAKTFSLGPEWGATVLDYAGELSKQPSTDSIHHHIDILKKLFYIPPLSSERDADFFERSLCLAVAVSSCGLEKIEVFLSRAFAPSVAAQPLRLSASLQGRLEHWIDNPKFTLEDSISISGLLMLHCMLAPEGIEKLLLGVMAKAGKNSVLTYADLKGLAEVISTMRAELYTEKVKIAFRDFFCSFPEKLYSLGNLVEDFQKEGSHVFNPPRMAFNSMQALQELIDSLCLRLGIEAGECSHYVACLWINTIAREMSALRLTYAEWHARAKPKLVRKVHPRVKKEMIVSLPLAYMHLKSVRRLPFHSIKLALLHILQQAYGRLSASQELQKKAFETIVSISKVILNPWDKYEPQIVLGTGLTWGIDPKNKVQ